MRHHPSRARAVIVAAVAAAISVPGIPFTGAGTRVSAAGGTTRLVSSSQGGTPGDGNSFAAQVSPDGSLVTFESEATNLLPSPDPNGRTDIFVKSMVTGAVELVTEAFGGGFADAGSNLWGIADDGRYVVFQSAATNLTATALPAGQSRLYIRDRVTATTTLFDVGHGGRLSSDGAWLFFNSSRSDLVPGQDDDNSETDVFRLEVATGDVEVVGLGDDGSEADGYTELRFISANGRYVGFWSYDETLVDDDTSGFPDIFVRDLLLGRTERVSVNPSGGDSHDICGCTTYGAAGGVSDDGRWVLFDSRADDIVGGDGNGERDVFLRDMVAGTTRRVNLKANGTQGNGSAYYSSLTPDGAFAVYASYATDLVAGSLSAPNAILSDLATAPPTHTVISQGAGGPTGGVLPGYLWTSVSDDGRFISFTSNTGTAGPSGSFQVYLRDLVEETTPPEVIGIPDRAPNLAGWYSAPVTIDWVATDPAPSSGTPTDPPDTQATTQAESHEYESEDSCDPAGNCASGTLELSIDMTDPVAGPPTVSPADVGLGDTATILLPATDALSGVAGGEWFIGADPGEGNGAFGNAAGGTVAFVVGSDLPAGSHSISVRAVDAAGNWSAVRTISLRVTGLESIESCNFEQDATESADAIRSYSEQGRTVATLCRALPLDIATPGRWGPTKNGAGFNPAAGLSPGTVAAGSTVRSFLVHADRAYAVTVNGDYLVRQVRLDFTGGTILGLVVRDASLNTTDVLGAPGTLLPTALPNRGHEINVVVNKKFLNEQDYAILSADRTSVTLNLQVGEAMDQVRVITTAGAVLAPTSTGFRAVQPPPSVRQDESNSEVCNGTQPPPKGCNVPSQQLLNDDVVVLFEQTVQDVILRDPLAVNIGSPGAYTVLPATPPAIAAGTPIRSHLLHVDRPGPSTGFPPGDFEYFYGTVFDRPVLGVITSDANLHASDVMGASGTYYATGTAARGADFGGGPGVASDERVQLSEDRLTVTIRFHTANGLDEVRVITAGGPPIADAFVKAVDTHLEVDGSSWTIHGASTYHTTNRGGPNDPDELIAMAQAGDLNILRIGEMFDQINGLRSAPYDESDWQRIDLFLDKLRGTDLRAILDLSAFRNHLVHRDLAEGGFTERCKEDGTVTVPERLTVDFEGTSPYRASAYAEWDRFLAFVANRVNTVNGIPYRHDPTIAIVSIAGEPEPPGSLRCGKAFSTAELTAFYAHTMAVWDSYDSRHLLSNGGFIHLDWEELHENPFGSGIDWQTIFALPQNDIPSIHTYPARIDDGIPADFQSPKIGPYVNGLGKPWFTEEFGWRQGVGDVTRAGYYQWLYDRQQTYGSAGAAFWNLGFELADGTFDVGPSTPATWDVVVSNAP